MIVFDNFIMEDGSPIYLQLILFVKRGIASGTIADRDELPSRRVLSALLGVNPNTVQKAYRILEEEGLIESRSGAKSFVSVSAERAGEIRRQLTEADIGAAIGAMKQAGLSKAQALSLIDRLWE